VTELRDSSIWAATCDLTAQVLRNDRRPLLVPADHRSLRSAGHVVWTGADGRPRGGFLPGAGGLPPEDLAVLLNRYRQRFAGAGGGTARG
jgi:hypothetical protein